MKSQHVGGRKGTSALLVIPIAGLEEKEYPFELKAGVEELELQDQYRGDILIAGTISRVASQYHVRGTIAALQIGECDRCLAQTERKVEAEFSLFYRVSGEGPDLEGEDDDEEGVGGIYTLRADDHAIALDDEVVESLRLAYPMKNLCRSDCKGLCTRCGTDLNKSECSCDKGAVDPRWSKLEGLFPEDTELN